MTPIMNNDAGGLHRIALQWVERCAALLSADDWNNVRQALNEIHDQLREDMPDDAQFNELFPVLVGGLIDRLGNRPIASLPQAQIYMSSADESHRAAAAAWLRQNRN